MNESTERMIQAIVGISHEPLIALDKSLTIVSANQAFGKMFTVPEDKVTGETIYNLGCNQFDTSDFRRFIDLALSQDTIDGYELDHAFPSSEIRKLHLNTRLLHTEPENGQILLISLADGSGKESGADARLHLERVINFNKAMLAAIPTPVFYKDTQGRYLGCNNAFTEFTGVSDAQIKGKSVEELWPDEYAKVYHKTDMEILDNPARLVYEFKMRDMHGEARQVIYVKDVFRDENEQIAGIVGAFVDITERERTKEILLENEERFRRIFEEGPIGMVINDLDFRFSQVNSAFCKMLGYSQDELLRLTFKDITQPEHVSIDVAHLEKLIAGEIPVYKTEKHYLRKDKKEIWCSTTATAVHDKNGNCIYMLTMIEDITDRKTHEAAIIKLNAELEERVASRTSELKIANEQLGHEIAEKEAAGKILMSQRDINEKFRDMTEMTSDWLWEINTEGAYTYVSFKIRDILGYEPEEVLGKTPFDFMSPEEIKRVGPVFESYVTQNKPFSLLVNTNIHKDGHLVVLETNGVPIFDENHVLRGYRGIDRDITERKAAENVLRESEEKFRILFESSRDAIMIMGDDGYCIDCNSATENMYGYTREEFRKLNPWAVSPEFQDDGTSSKQAAMENNRKALAGETTKFEWINIRKDGSHFNAEAMLSPMDLNGKNVIQIIIRDITERKTAETALLKSEEKFRNLFESSRDSLMILDDGHFIDCNSATVKMFGYTVQEFCEISPWDVSPEFQEDGTPSKQAAMKKIQKALLDEMPTFEWIHRRKDSTDFNAEVTLSSVEMHGKKVVQALVRDITERKTAETALRESEEKFRNLFATSRDAIMILGDGRFIECNPATLHMFGY
ncbi:MAG: PAS domain S-box protein, partial [Elusimicrobiaceae bacterium]